MILRNIPRRRCPAQGLVCQFNEWFQSSIQQPCAWSYRACHPGTRSQASAECARTRSRAVAAAVAPWLRTAGRSWSGRVARRRAWLDCFDTTYYTMPALGRVVHGDTFIHHSILSIVLAWLIMAEQMCLCVLQHIITNCPCSAMLTLVQPV